MRVAPSQQPSPSCEEADVIWRPSVELPPPTPHCRPSSPPAAQPLNPPRCRQKPPECRCLKKCPSEEPVPPWTAGWLASPEWRSLQLLLGSWPSQRLSPPSPGRTLALQQGSPVGQPQAQEPRACSLIAMTGGQLLLRGHLPGFSLRMRLHPTSAFSHSFPTAKDKILRLICWNAALKKRTEQQLLV
jgi:hypothetical protein